MFLTAQIKKKICGIFRDRFTEKSADFVFEENLAPTQYAYRQGCNCTDALINMQYNCLKALDDRECRYVQLFAMDFAKAFDKVRHSILSEKLKDLNVHPYFTNGVLVFLQNHKRLVFRGFSYCQYNANKGTTQGSISGPYLFNLFINDLDLVNCPDASLSKYANDTTMQVIVNKAGTNCASDVISQYLSWSSTNYMPCNLSKGNELVLKKKGQAIPSPIGNIEQAEFLVLLGVTFQGMADLQNTLNENSSKQVSASMC